MSSYKKPNCIVIKVHLKESNSANLIFTSLLSGGHLLKEEICSFRYKIFLLRVYIFWEAFALQESKLEVTKVVSIFNPIALRKAKIV